MKKEIQVVMLPTEKVSKEGMICKRPSDGALAIINCLTVEDPNHKKLGYINNHLYFLSDEKIEIGDWILSGVNSDSLQPKQVTSQTLIDDLFPWEKKIVATTDPQLGLPRPSNEFLKKYCELGGVSSVLVDYTCKAIDCKINCNNNNNCAATSTLKVAPDNTISIYSI
jgi:hypothetical protein